MRSSLTAAPASVAGSRTRKIPEVFALPPVEWTRVYPIPAELGAPQVETRNLQPCSQYPLSLSNGIFYSREKVRCSDCCGSLGRRCKRIS
jgi:hypothetical protein